MSTPPPYQPDPSGASLTPPPYGTPAEGEADGGSGAAAVPPPAYRPPPAYPAPPSSGGYPPPSAPAGYPGVAQAPAPDGARVVEMPGGLFSLVLPQDWPVPPFSWVAASAGMPIGPEQTPQGARPAPSGWQFWRTNEPMWTEWLRRARSSQLRWVLIGAGISIAALVFTIVSYVTAKPGSTYVVLWGVIVFGAIAAIRAGAQLARLSRDPWSIIRQAVSPRAR